MCDTMYVNNGSGRFFAKNSDRSCNEPNLTLFVEAADYPRDCMGGYGQVRCTYISIPQVAHTNAMVLVKPSWLWGAEMGVNDKGLVIGNEAVFTKSKGKKEKNLIGMDYLRLALERCDDVESALQLITAMLVKYGQGGNCGFDKNFFYDNSYLLAYGEKAVILETCGREYKTREIDGFGNISNRLSIEDNDFAKRNSDILFTTFSGSLERSSQAKCAISKATSVADVIKALSQHEEGMSDEKLFAKGSVKSVCMHQSSLGDHTTGSFIFDFNTGVAWVSGCSTPCLAIFKPVLFGEIIPPVFSDENQSLDYWLTREYLVRAIYGGSIDLAEYRTKRAKLQEKMLKEYDLLAFCKADRAAIMKFCVKCEALESQFIEEYGREIQLCKNNKIPQKGIWAKYYTNLGKKVFARTVKERK